MPSKDEDCPTRSEAARSSHKRTSDEIIRLVEEADREERRALTDAFLIVIGAAAIALGITGGMFVVDSVILTTFVFLGVFYVACRILLRLIV